MRPAELFSIQAQHPIPELGAEAGDWLTIDPSDPEHPITVTRLCDWRRVQRALDRIRGLETFAAAFAGAGLAPRPAEAGASRPSTHLRLEK